MRPLITIFFAIAFSAIAVVPKHADAAVDVSVNIGLPVAPPLVVVQPGVQVVENFDEEVFFVQNRYWVRRGPYWYRARSPRARFVMVPERAVPVTLVRMPPGQYVRYKRARHEEREWERHERHEHDRGNGHGHGGERGHGRGHGKWKD